MDVEASSRSCEALATCYPRSCAQSCSRTVRLSGPKASTTKHAAWMILKPIQLPSHRFCLPAGRKYF
eukprot:3688864-Amphidinium_carterae.1